MMIDLLTFDEAQKDASRFPKKHLLLGNGFSIACKPDIFTYGSLFEKADFSSMPNVPKMFEALDTTDFEHVIKMLENASKALPIYDPSDRRIAAQMTSDAEKLKTLLIETVGSNHPGVPNEIEDQKFWSCRKFLANFLGPENKDGRVFTLNYDLLLYWTLMHDDMPFDAPLELVKNDGFGRDDDTDPEFVNWMGESNDKQRVHYLHGALHLFDGGSELKKYTWKNTGTPLLEQARAEMDQDNFPLFVAEGSSRQKLKKIKHSAFFYHSYKSFSKLMQGKDVFFIFGHSLADNDAHILKKISSGKIPKLYIGLYGDAALQANKDIITAATRIVTIRNERHPLELSFFDAASAKVWDHS